MPPLLRGPAAGVAMLSLYSWLMALAARLGSHGRGALPPQLAIITDKARARDHCVTSSG